MANIKSAEKRARIAEKARLRNKMYKSAMKTRIKNFERLVAEEDMEKAEAAFKDASSYLDKLVSKGIIHKNAAARKKSRLHKRIKNKVV
ncbi:MAG TPA: 30S ribosomal protein S20 [Clostridia bacterium]|nr:30S ribosomal protein S20 [Clostridia bacterium]